MYNFYEKYFQQASSIIIHRNQFRGIDTALCGEISLELERKEKMKYFYELRSKLLDATAIENNRDIA